MQVGDTAFPDSRAERLLIPIEPIMENPLVLSDRTSRLVHRMVAGHTVTIGAYALCVWSAAVGTLVEVVSAWSAGAVFLYAESLALAAVPWVAPSVTRTSVRGSWICGLHGAAAGALVAGSGGTESPMACWLVAVPLLACVLGGSRALAVACLAACAAALATHGIPSALSVPFWADRASIAALGPIGLLGGLVLGVLIAFLAGLRQSAARDRCDELESAIERRDLARRDFLSKMSHELRTPLTAIHGFAEEMTSRPGNAEWARGIDTIRRNSRALLASLDDLMEWERIANGEGRARRADHDSHPFFAGIEEAIRAMPSPQVDPVSLELVGDVPDRIGIDGELATKAIVKTVAGAVQATGRGGIRLRIEFATDSPLCEVTVAPDRHSWHDYELAGLFESPGGVETVGAFSIALAQNWLRLLGGTVAPARIEKPRSAAIRVTLPFEPASPRVGPGNGSAERDGAGSAAAQRIEGARILIVEDSVDTRALITRLLTRSGAIVQGVENGQAAVTAVFAAEAMGAPFDVVLMDMQLPLLDGCEATRRLRAEGFRRPILAFTAQSVGFPREVCLAAGCDDYLTKPFRSAEILERIAHHANRSLKLMLKP